MPSIDATTTSSHARLPLLLWALGVFLVGSTLYVGTLQHGFVLDDQRAIIGNRCVNGRHPAGTLSCAFSHDFWGRPAREVGRTYRPLVVLSFALDWQIGAGTAWLFHLENALLHGIATALCFLWLARLAPRVASFVSPVPLGLLALATAVFAAHASHVDAVAGIVGRADIMAVIFGLLALTLHLAPRGWLAGVGLGACFTLALCSHELAVLLPVFAAISDFCQPAPSRRAWLRRHLPRLAIWLLVLVSYLAVRSQLMGRLVGPVPDILNNPAASATPWERLLLGLSLARQAISIWIAPLNLSAEYGYGQIAIPRSVLEPTVLLGAALLALLVGGLLFLRERGPFVAMGCGFVLSSLLLTSNVLLLMPTAFAERLLYVPSLGLSLLFAGALSWAFGKSKPHNRVAVVAVVLFVGVNAALAVGHSRHWRDNVTLFAASVASCPKSARAQLNLGLSLNQAGRPHDAIKPLRTALAIMPSLTIAAGQLAIAYDLTGKPTLAARTFESAYRVARDNRTLVRNYFAFLRRHRRWKTAKGLVRAHPWLTRR